VWFAAPQGGLGRLGAARRRLNNTRQNNLHQENEMAQLIGGLGTSHIPAIGNAIHKGLQNEPYWKPFFDGFPPIRQWLGEKKPDVVVMFYNDHGLNFFLDKMPTFAVGAAAQYNNADEGWGIPTLPPFLGEVDLSWHLINTLIAQEFDVTPARRCW